MKKKGGGEETASCRNDNACVEIFYTRYAFRDWTLVFLLARVELHAILRSCERSYLLAFRYRWLGRPANPTAYRLTNGTVGCTVTWPGDITFSIKLYSLSPESTNNRGNNKTARELFEKFLSFVARETLRTSRKRTNSYKELSKKQIRGKRTVRGRGAGVSTTDRAKGLISGRKEEETSCGVGKTWKLTCPAGMALLASVGG